VPHSQPPGVKVDVLPAAGAGAHRELCGGLVRIWRRWLSGNVKWAQERLNKEIKRRTKVVGIFPTRASAIRLVGMILAEQDNEWQDGRRYFRPETMAAIDAVAREEVTPPLMVS
jgi:hypothetical protein